MQEVLVLVTDRCDYQRLIWLGEEIAGSEGMPLHVISVKPRRALRDDQGAQIERLFTLARGAKAEMTVYYNDDPGRATVQHIRRYAASRVVADVPSSIRESEMIGQVRKNCPEIPIHLVDDKGMLSGYPTMFELAKTAVAI